MSPYYPTIDEDLKRADEIIEKGKADRGDTFFGPTELGGTIYGGDTYAAYMLLKSFVEHIRYAHQQSDAGHVYLAKLERKYELAVRLNKRAAKKIAALEQEQRDHDRIVKRVERRSR